MSVVFQSRAMAELLEVARRYARSSATILITGESGTGKEVLARWIHEHSQRNEKPFVRVNCAALSEGLIESELFGHERGAFTGAEAARDGRLEAARCGTLMLDEISEISMRFQAKLLRVLEEEEFQRVGSDVTVRADVRVIATTNRPLDQEVARNRFRTDLYYRVNVLHLHISALRERVDDIPILVHHFLSRFGTEGAVPVKGFAPKAMQRLCEHSWPGNIRELRNLVHRICVLCRDEVVQVDDLPLLDSPQERESPVLPTQFQKMRLDEIERRVILSRIAHFNGNKSAAAEELGVTDRTLRNKMSRYRRLGFV